MKNFYWLLIFFAIFTVQGNSRPISYPGGWTVMQMNDFNRNSIHLHISPSINYSLGYRGEYWKKKEWQFHGIQLNHLLKRLNNPKSQANFYLKNGLGSAVSNFRGFNNRTELNFFSGVSFDWEDRQFFTSYENRINYNNSIDKFFMQKARLGFAPYIGEYGDLHTWLMLQIEHMPQSADNIIYTPILRTFKGDFLAEIGLNNNKKFLLNFIKRF